MTKINIKDLISILPDLISMFVSGFIFMHIYDWIICTKRDVTVTILWSLFISFMIANFFSFLHSFVFTTYNFPESFKVIIYLISGCILPFITNFLQKKILQRILYLSTHKSINTDIFDDIIDYDEPTMLQVYLKNSDIYYIGKFCYREEKGLDSWIVLINYGAIKKENNDIDYSPADECLKSTVAINLRDVERIEVIYEDNSKVWTKLSGN